MENLKKHIEELNNIIYQRVISGNFVLKKTPFSEKYY